MDVSEGQVLAGKYRIERVLGRGGMGLVVAATHLQLGDRVALKLLLPESLHNPEAVLRFDREARAAVRIKSEHVARVSDVGKLDNGAPYMVMEYLDGIDLSLWLTQRGALPIEQAVEFVLQACEAIAEAHTLGIVHRDLKPANLFVIERPDGALAVKVLDFGISKSTGLAGSGADITKTTAAMGSPLYMSPEQMQSAKDVDPRGDIWALGVVLYELISARLPFPGETMAELILKVITAPPIPLRAVCAQAPAGLEALLLKCLEKDRNLRFQSVAELAVALFEFAPRRAKTSVERIGRIMQRAGMSASMTQMPPSSEPVAAHAVRHTLASWGQTNPPTNHRRRAVVVAILLAASTVAVVALAWLRSGGPHVGSASNAVPLGSISLAQHTVTALQSTTTLQSARPALLAEAAPPLVTAGAAPASTAPGLVAPSVTVHVPPKQATSTPPLGSQRTAANATKPSAVTSAQAAPTPSPTAPTVVSKPATPALPTNPLKMWIQ